METMKWRKRIAWMIVALVLTVILFWGGEQLFLWKTDIIYYDVETKVEVRLSSDWSSMDHDGSVFQSLIDEFNRKNPDMVVVNDWRQKDEYFKYLRTDIASGNEPDIFISYPGELVEEYFAADRLSGLNEYLAEDEQWFDSFDKSVWRYVTYEGEIYALPLENIYAAMFVNVDLLNRYGLGIPATYEDWKKMIPVLKAEGIIPIAFNLSDNELMLYQAIVAKLGGRFYSDDIEKNGAYNEYYAAAAEYLKELYQLGAFPDNLFSITENESEELFLQKKAAFIVQDSHFVTNIQNIDDGSTKICYMPSFENERSSERSALYGLGKNNLFVSAKSMESKEEYVIRFLKYMTSREVATKLKDELGALSAVNPNENMYLGNIAYVNSEFTYSLTETVHFISNYNDNGKWNKIVERMPSYLESRIDVWTLLE